MTGYDHTCDRDNHHPPAGADRGPVMEAPPVESGPSLPHRHGRQVVQTLVWI